MAKLHLMNKLGRIYLTWTRKLQRELVPHDISLKQQFVLKQLKKKSFLYPFQIAEMLYCDRPTATVIIKNLEKKGWVKRERDPENARQYRISITEDGLIKLESLYGACGPKDMDRFDPLKCLSSEEREQLEQLIMKVFKNMDY
ncbi:MarR family transcriptional regulator [Vallitalea pronyensis]|uniref:MarR family transcriptional regulator n=1 Tax=Vallitalea pronyensis TaxID=1348613 RepID=A0A8J8MG69_9FIRM|nr:MarR family transcriptional regulator [Vallitalea pronyensis]QUI21000.1 MarR family transcriptional regulator [Vallitalea pronyensis]